MKNFPSQNAKFTIQQIRGIIEALNDKISRKYGTFPQGTGLKVPFHNVGDGIWSLFCMIFRYLVYQFTKEFQTSTEGQYRDEEEK